MIVLQIIGYTLGAALIIAVLSLVVSIVTWVAHQVEDFIQKTKSDWLDLKDKAKQVELNAVRVLKPNEQGRQGIVFDGKTYRDADSGEVFTIELVKHLDPVRFQLNQIQKTLMSMQGVSVAPQATVESLMTGEAQPQALPETITLREAMSKYNVRPGIHNVFLGVGLEGPVLVDMQKAVHMLVSGASGFGKSTLMEAIAKQLVLGGDCDLAYIDYGVNTFGMLQQYSAYQVADSPEMAISLFRELIDEGLRRKELLREYPRAKTIDDYNRITGDDLRPIVCFVDEAAPLFSEQDTKQPITTLAQMARKFGMWLILGGTDFKATTIPSNCTGNCGARVGFHLQPGLSRSLLNCTNAFELDQAGRALAMIPGQKMQEIQCPIVTSWDDLPSANVEVKELVSSTLESRIVGILPTLDKVSISSVCRAIGLNTGGGDFYTVKEALQRMGEI